MSTQLKASLLLKLEDQLTAGLGKLQKQLEQLRDLAKSLGLGELADGIEQLRGGAGSIDAMTESLRGTERQADRTAQAIKRMGAAANDNVIRVNSAGQAFQTRSLGALTIVPLGGGMAPASAGQQAGGSGPVVPPLLLSGAAGGIPLHLRPDRLGRAATGIGSTGRGMLDATEGLGSAANNAIGGATGAAMEGFAVYEPIKAYAGFENVLRHIAITEKLHGAAVDAEVKRLTSMFRKDALETGQSSDSIARAYSDLVQMGISSSIIDKAISAHSHAATAYNISAEAIGPAVGALLQNMKIPEADIGSALAAMAYASKEGRFKVEDFSRQFPGTSGYLSLLGMTGRHNTDIGFAALETVMKNAAEPNQAAADFNDALHYLTAPIARRSFAKGGINLPKLLENAQRQGIDPLDAVLGKLDQKTRGMDPVKAAEYLGTLLHNQQAGMGILSLLQHKGDFLKLVPALDKVDRETLNTDFTSAFAAPEVQLRLLNERTAQLTQLFGEGFLPTIRVVGAVLGGLLSPLAYLTENFPKITQAVLGTMGGFLLLAAAVGVFKVVAPLFVGAWKVVTAVLEFSGAIFDGLYAVFLALLPPIGLIIAAVAALAAAAYEIYEHWGHTGRFFEDLWSGVKGTFTAFVAWVDGWAGGLGTRILNGIKAGWKALVDGIDGLIKRLEPHFSFDLHMPFGPDSPIGRLLHLHELPQLQPPGRSAADGAAGQAAPGSRQDQLAITVSAAPGTAVTSVKASTNPNHTVTTVQTNTGRVLGRR